MASKSPTKWGDIAIGGGAVWTSAFGKPLTRIDPVTNSVTHQFVSLGGDSVRYGYGVLWLTDQKSNLLWKIKPSSITRKPPKN